MRLFAMLTIFTLQLKPVWNYINEHDLKDGKHILVDEKLGTLCENEQIHMFHVTKVICAHLVKSGSKVRH